MPVNKNAFIRYRVIDSLLRTKGFVKTSDIVEKLWDQHDLDVSPRTINKDIQALETDFLAPIEYDNSQKAYYYPENVAEIFPTLDLQIEEINALTFYAKTLQQYRDFDIFKDFTNAIDKIVDAVKIKSRQNEVTDRIKIQPENFPKFQGSDLIPEIISGFDSNKKFEFIYQKHNSKDSKQHIVTPILLKEYDHLWYLLAKREGKDYVTTFALDRITEFKITENKCEDVSTFNIDEYYNHAFGIAVPEGNVEDVLLEFVDWRGRYLISAPIHKSQEFVEEKDGKIILRIKVIPFHELHSKILSYGDNVRVLAPESLKLKIKELLQNTIEKY